MIIKPNFPNIDELFSGGNQYKIPIYQRHYVWNTNNWEKLWTDITHMPTNGLFTGIIVTRKDEDTEGKHDVIDGQQRLTTYQIILCVIRDICASNFPRYTGPLTSEEYIILISTASPNNDDRYRLLLKEGPDQEAFRLLVNRGPVGTDHPIHNAYIHFKEQIEGYNITELGSLHDKITRSINVAQIELESGLGDVSEKIFASLNGTGRMLNEFDYLRNDLFLRVGSSRAKGFYDSPKYWHPNFEMKESKPGRLESFLDAFLRNFLKAILGPKCFRDNIKPFDLYQEKLKKTDSEIDQEFIQLSWCAEFHKELHDSSSDIGRSMQFYNDLSLPRLDSFMLFAKQKLATPTSAVLLQVCNILESYIMRRMLCYSDWKRCYEVINNFFEQMQQMRGTFSIENLKDALASTNPTDNEVRDHLKGVGYKDEQPNLYILYRIETKHRPCATEFNSFKLLKIQYGLEPHLENSIGNITLQTSDPPLEWPRLPFNKKKSALKANVAPGLFLTDKICRIGKSGKWGENQIRKMEKYLSDQFIKIWSG